MPRSILANSVNKAIVVVLAVLLFGSAAPPYRALFLPALVGSSHHGFIVLSSDGRSLYDDSSATPLVAASTQKLLVTVTALHVLGPQFAFTSRFISVPTANGDPMLWFVGSGDPLLTRQELRAGVRELVRQGIRRVAGIGVDGTSVTTPELNPTWNPQDDDEGFQAPTSGLSLDQDTVEVHVAAATMGMKARITVHPAGSVVTIHNGVVSSASPGSVDVFPDGPNAYTFSGTIASNEHRKFWLPLHAMPHDLLSVLHAMLVHAGIRVGPKRSIGSSGWGGEVLWTHRGIPLRAVLRRMLLESNNHIAEQLLVAVSRRIGGIGNDRIGLRYELAYLHRLGIPLRDFHLIDGSGLSHANRITMVALARLLVLERRELFGLLPGSGHGTLQDDDFGVADGRIRAKTGHLDGVSALVGYLHTIHHGTVIFAFAVDASQNDPDTAFEHALDAIARW
ncbi:MAG: D-alanyl-D-alanine carboxypeptidase/D-alanyl-D-alanine endopeptidase [Vulcanimicrobiaceae bacterium]